MYGIPHSGAYEDYDVCARAVSDVLNSVEGQRRWMPDNIARVHRVGQSRNGEPKPTIVKFIKQKDKTAILRNRKYKDDLEKNDVRVANDLTKNQASVVAEATRKGKLPTSEKVNRWWDPHSEHRFPAPFSKNIGRFQMTSWQ